MACSSCGKLCSHLIISEGVTFSNNNLLINIPQSAYENGETYCIIVGQEIPPETTIAANVGITIGDDDTTIYPLVNSNCTNVNAYQISARTRYTTKVQTNIQSGVFRLMNNLCCGGCGANVAPSLPLSTVVQKQTDNTEVTG